VGVSHSYTLHLTDGVAWTFTGDLTYRSPEGLTMNFSGLPSLNNQTTTCDYTGHFWFTIQLTPTDNGIAYVKTTDWYGLTSNTASEGVAQL